MAFVLVGNIVEEGKNQPQRNDRKRAMKWRTPSTHAVIPIFNGPLIVMTFYIAYFLKYIHNIFVVVVVGCQMLVCVCVFVFFALHL